MTHEPLSNFYVYVIFRPNGEPCYVGKGRRDRWVNWRRSHNQHLASIIRAHGRLPVVKVRMGLSESEAFSTEIAFISAIGREVYGGPLVNQTDGGDGTSGFAVTTATRNKISASTKGKPKSAETRKRMSEANIGKVFSPDTLAKMSAAKIGTKSRVGKKHSALSLAKMSAAHLGYVHTSEARAKMSAQRIGKPKTPEHVAKVNASNAARRAKLISGVTL